MVKFRHTVDEARMDVDADGVIERCIKCGGRLTLKRKHESRRKCRDCIDEMMGAKEMYKQR